MIDKPILSIVIANYNYGRYLSAAIESVLQQCERPCKVDGRNVLPVKGTKESVELIICDAQSKDESLAVMMRYEDSLAWWCSERDAGQSAAFNKGFSHAKGEWLTWLNADEEYLPGCFRALCKKARQCPSARWITGNMLKFDLTTRRISYVAWGPHWQPFFLKYKRACIDVFGPSSFFTRDLYNEIGPINEACHYTMDHEYWTRINMAGIRQTRLNFVCWAFGVQSDSKSAGNITESAIRQGRLERAVRERETGYTYRINYKNPWYCVWLAMRVLDGSLLVRWFKRHKYIGSTFVGCLVGSRLVVK